MIGLRYIARITYNKLLSRAPIYRLFCKTVIQKNKPHITYQNFVCKFCNGCGLVDCFGCGGRGKIYFDGFKEIICETCAGSGSHRCSICNGNGRCHMIF